MAPLRSVKIFSLLVVLIVGLTCMTPGPATARPVLVETVNVTQSPPADTTPGTVKVKFEFRNGPRPGDTFVHEIHQWGEPVHDYQFKPGKQFVGEAEFTSEGDFRRFSLGQNRKELKLLVLFVTLAVVLFVVGRWEGVVGLGSALLTVLLLYFLLFPFVSNPLLILPLAGLICLITIFFTIFLVTGFSPSAWPASLSLLLVTLVVFGFTTWSLGFLHLDSTRARNSRLILTWLNSLPGITPGHLWQLVTVGIVLSCLGAMMDVTVVISSTITEIHRDRDSVEFSRAYRNGVNVGRRILATMINTLVFAYLGLLLPTLLAVEVFDLAWIYILNYDYLGLEILRLCAGLVGLSLTIPVTSALSAWWCENVA